MSAAQEESDRYHREYYSSHQLFEPGTWIEKPNSALLEIGDLLRDRPEVTILDLGSGVGRNAIPMAQILSNTVATIDCVDIVDIAIDKLKEAATYYKVAHIIKPFVANVAEFSVAAATYDLVMAMSVLEHAAGPDQFRPIMERVQTGTKVDGFNCLSITTNLRETHCESGESLTPLIANPISSEACEGL